MTAMAGGERDDGLDDLPPDDRQAWRELAFLFLGGYAPAEGIIIRQRGIIFDGARGFDGNAGRRHEFGISRDGEIAFAAKCRCRRQQVAPTVGRHSSAPRIESRAESIAFRAAT